MKMMFGLSAARTASGARRKARRTRTFIGMSEPYSPPSDLTDYLYDRI
jgi:hypothetical protein